VRVKGWLRGDDLYVEVRFEPRAKGLSLHSLALVTPAGEAHAPDSWRDQTPKGAPISVGVGMGIPLGGGGHHGAHGGGLALGPGVSVPLSRGGGEAVTAGEARWNVAAKNRALPVTACTLRIKLISVQRDFAHVTTLPLTMTVHQDAKSDRPSATLGAPAPTTQPAATPPKDERPPDSAEKAARGLVREIDFTLKAPPTTKRVAL
jgi:hypothetical protein